MAHREFPNNFHYPHRPRWDRETNDIRIALVLFGLTILALGAIALFAYAPEIFFGLVTIVAIVAGVPLGGMVVLLIMVVAIID